MLRIEKTAETAPDPEERRSTSARRGSSISRTSDSLLMSATSEFTCWSSTRSTVMVFCASGETAMRARFVRTITVAKA